MILFSYLSMKTYILGIYWKWFKLELPDVLFPTFVVLISVLLFIEFALLISDLSFSSFPSRTEKMDITCIHWNSIIGLF